MLHWAMVGTESHEGRVADIITSLVARGLARRELLDELAELDEQLDDWEMDRREYARRVERLLRQAERDLADKGLRLSREGLVWRVVKV